MNIDRRKFIKLSVSGLAGLCGCGTGFLKGRSEYSMVENYSKLRKRRYSCAETMFLNIVKYLNEPEDLVSISTGFGGGIKMRDLCGFYTGGVMGIGQQGEAGG